MSQHRRPRPRPSSATSSRPRPGAAAPPGAEPPHEPAVHEGADDPRVPALLGLIAAGHLDDDLAALQTALVARQRTRLHALAREAAAAVQLGDRVRVGAAVRPHYLRGATGTIVAWAGTSAVVELDAPTGGALSGQVRCPPLLLELLPRGR